MLSVKGSSMTVGSDEVDAASMVVDEVSAVLMMGAPALAMVVSVESTVVDFDLVGRGD